MLITELLKQNADQYPKETALVAVESEGLLPEDPLGYTARRSSITWEGFNQMSNQIAQYYLSLGIGKESHVGLLMRNCLEWLPIYFGILKSGAVVVPLNFRYDVNELAWNIAFADLDALVFDQHCVSTVSACSEQFTNLRSLLFSGKDELCPSFAHTLHSVWKTAKKEDPEISLYAEEDAAIYFSSGTTGIPKAVVYTHATLEAACLLEQSNHRQTHEDCFLCIPPLYHVGAKLHWMGNLLVGAKGVLLLGFTVTAFFETLSRESVSIAFLLLPWAQDILVSVANGSLRPDQYQLNAWRMLHMGAQPIPPSVVRRLHSTFPKVALEISYGLTEAGGPGCLNLSSAETARPGSVGIPGSGWEAMLINENGDRVPPGALGELLVRGPHMMRCYYKDPQATGKALEDGWLHTGDIARQDEEGFYYIVDRKKELIITGGEKIYPDQVENYLRNCPDIKDAAVFGLHHCRLGEVAVALIELVPGTVHTEEELLGFCQGLPRYKRPVRIFFGTVPRNPTGKIEKNLLRKWYANAMNSVSPASNGCITVS